MSADRQSVTNLLQQWRGGDNAALDQLMPIVYNELRRLAGRCLQSERPGHTLRATALVHEAYIRLMDADIGWQDRAHFYAVAARVVRRILVEYARTHSRQKRGGGEEMVPLDEAVIVGPEAASTVLQAEFRRHLKECTCRLVIFVQLFRCQTIQAFQRNEWFLCH